MATCGALNNKKKFTYDVRKVFIKLKDQIKKNINFDRLLTSLKAPIFTLM